VKHLKESSHWTSNNKQLREYIEKQWLNEKKYKVSQNTIIKNKRCKSNYVKTPNLAYISETVRDTNPKINSNLPFMSRNILC
jgi:hypothetical protein